MTPTPRMLYVHDDLTDEVRERHGADSDALSDVQALLALVARDTRRVRILTFEEQLDALTRGHHAPFAVAVGIGRAGERVARRVHARTGWFPLIERVELTREEQGDGYVLSTLGKPPLDPANPPLTLRERFAALRAEYFGDRKKLFSPYVRYGIEDPLPALIWSSKMFAARARLLTRRLGR